MKGGYSAVAAYLTALSGKRITRQQVYLWNIRRTLNAAGQPPPSPLESSLHARSRQPRLLFDLAAFADWYRAGPPAAGVSQAWQDAEVAARQGI
jgi:hypothetical protein